MPSQVVSLETAKKRLGIVSDHRDDEIQMLIDAAIPHIENEAQYYLQRRVIHEPLDDLVSAVDLMSWPVSSVSSINYIADDGAFHQIDDARLISNKKPAFLMPAIGKAWPADVDLKLTASIIVGHVGSNDDPYPAQLIQAILLLVGHWFENHEAVVVGTIAADLPIGISDICYQFRKVLG